MRYKMALWPARVWISAEGPAFGDHASECGLMLPRPKGVAFERHAPTHDLSRRGFGARLRFS
jgi:hypothetical protein